MNGNVGSLLDLKFQLYAGPLDGLCEDFAVTDDYEMEFKDLNRILHDLIKILDIEIECKDANMDFSMARFTQEYLAHMKGQLGPKRTVLSLEEIQEGFKGFMVKQAQRYLMLDLT